MLGWGVIGVINQSIIDSQENSHCSCNCIVSREIEDSFVKTVSHVVAKISVKELFVPAQVNKMFEPDFSEVSKEKKTSHFLTEDSWTLQSQTSSTWVTITMKFHCYRRKKHWSHQKSETWHYTDCCLHLWRRRNVPPGVCPSWLLKLSKIPVVGQWNHGELASQVQNESPPFWCCIIPRVCELRTEKNHRRLWGSIWQKTSRIREGWLLRWRRTQVSPISHSTLIPNKEYKVLAC